VKKSGQLQKRKSAGDPLADQYLVSYSNDSVRIEL
jgi:hypothetical protein